MNQCSQHNRKDIDRIRQTVLSLDYWYTKAQSLDTTKKSPSTPKWRQKSHKKNLITTKKKKKRKIERKEQMEMMSREEKQMMKTMEGD